MGSRYDLPIAELFRLSESMPADTGDYRGRIISVNQTGDVAFAAVAEDGFWGTVSFVDYFLLPRIEGTVEQILQRNPERIRNLDECLYQVTELNRLK